MGTGTKADPYTRKDVLRLIKANGGTAKGLDLSGKWFEHSINLKGLNLTGIILNKAVLANARLERAVLADTNLEGANLACARLEEAILEGAHLEGAILFAARLEGAILWHANLKGANLGRAHLEGANLGSIEFSRENKMGDVLWGNYILGEERIGDFDSAAATYRRLKTLYTEYGMYDVAGKFFFREMTVSRKMLQWLPNPLPKVRETLYWLLCGYGERPWQVFVSAAAVVLVLASIYFAIGTLTPSTFPHSLYYSMVSFTALGYGSWTPEPTGWVKWLGACEAFVGVSMIALFLVTFTRKMIR